MPLMGSMEKTDLCSKTPIDWDLRLCFVLFVTDNVMLIGNRVVIGE